MKIATEHIIQPSGWIREFKDGVKGILKLFSEIKCFPHDAEGIRGYSCL